MAEHSGNGPSVPLRAIRHFVIYLLTMPAALLAAAGEWSGPEAWGLSGPAIVFALGSHIPVARRTPGLLRGRGRALSSEDGPSWNRLLTFFAAWAGPLALWMVAGLDRRFARSGPAGIPFPPFAWVVAAAGSLLST